MKKFLLILICTIIAMPAFASNSNSTKYYKMNQYNSKGQKVGYTTQKVNVLNYTNKFNICYLQAKQIYYYCKS